METCGYRWNILRFRDLLISLVLIFGMPALVISSEYAGCKPYPIGPNSPTGVVGCVVYGMGTASYYGGTGSARNDCVYPWSNCQAITIRSADTGITIISVPNSFCDCYTTTSNERIIDLTEGQVLQLGLNLSTGLYRVEVQPYYGVITIPNTAMEPNDLFYR